MKGVVLCAGEGTRMRPLTYSLPKHLIPIANRPVIEHILDTLTQAGITDIGIVVGPNTQRSFQDALGDGSQFGVRLTYVVQEDPRGLAHAVACAHGFVGDDPFLLYLGDNLLEAGVTGPVERFVETKADAVITLYPVPDPSRFGVAEIAGDKIVRLVEKPATPVSNLAVVGAYVFSPEIFSAIAHIRPSARGELEITDAIQRLIDDGRLVLPYRISGWWRDVGRPPELLAANAQLLADIETKIDGAIARDCAVTGNVVVGPRSRIRNSTLIGPVMIGSGVTCSDSKIGPNVSIGDDAIITGTRMRASIVLTGAEITGVTLADSLIGRGTIVSKSVSQQVTSLLLGDHCRVELGSN